jgi:hypothetical protein
MRDFFFFLRLGSRSFQCFSSQASGTAWILRPEDWKGQVPSRKTTTTNWVNSLLVSILTGNYLINEARHPCQVIEESELVGLGHLTDAVRKALGFCLLANSKQPL